MHGPLNVKIRIFFLHISVAVCFFDKHSVKFWIDDGLYEIKYTKWSFIYVHKRRLWSFCLAGVWG
jgi:hypothetical protein